MKITVKTPTLVNIWRERRLNFRERRNSIPVHREPPKTAAERKCASRERKRQQELTLFATSQDSQDSSQSSQDIFQPSFDSSTQFHSYSSSIAPPNGTQFATLSSQSQFGAVQFTASPLLSESQVTHTDHTQFATPSSQSPFGARQSSASPWLSESQPASTNDQRRERDRERLAEAYTRDPRGYIASTLATCMMPIAPRSY